MLRHVLQHRFTRPLGVLAALVIALLVGCTTPQERYRVLSTFLDGVPDPSVRKTVVNHASENPEEGLGVVITASVMSRHKPFVTNQCAACHESAAGIVMDFDQAYKQCVKCHAKVSNERTLMHGPVAREACKWCHAPHESNEPALLKDKPIVVCTQCHDKQLLGLKPIEHTDGKTSCLQCHFGHGGGDHYFLKPAPATAPATAPAPPTTAPNAALDLPQDPHPEPQTGDVHPTLPRQEPAL